MFLGDRSVGAACPVALPGHYHAVRQLLAQLHCPPSSARVAAVSLIMYWHKDCHDMFEALMAGSCDVVYDFRSMGTGSAFEATKYGHAGRCLTPPPKQTSAQSSHCETPACGFGMLVCQAAWRRRSAGGR
jgi:hypothetical protein